MSQHLLVLPLIFATVLTTSATSRAGAAGRPDEFAIVKRVDHLIINASNAAAIFEFFEKKLGLPVAWPMATHGGAFASGGVFAGNVNIEVLRAAPSDSAGDAHLFGVAFEPVADVEATLERLDERGLRHGGANPFRGPDGNGGVQTLWTTTFLSQLLPASSWTFICDYAHDVDERRTMLAKKLDTGGPLGVVGVREIVIGIGDASEAMKRWRLFLGNAADDAGRFDFIGGPSVQLTEDGESEIQSIALEVRSLETAKQYLAEHGLLHTEGDIVLIKHEAAGARIVVVQVAKPQPMLLPPTPEDWRFERLEMPPEFAPNLLYRGYEELSFAPGMFEPEADSHFSYIFALRLDGKVHVDVPMLWLFLLDYYRGLCGAVAVGRALDVDLSTIAVEVARRGDRFRAAVEMYDVFVTGEPLRLILEIDARAGENTTDVFAVVSPKPKDAPIWTTLREMAEAWRAER